MNVMQNNGIHHCWQQSMAWSRAMEFYLQENSFFKTRLSQSLEKEINREVLEKAEYFQNCFIETDENIADLKKNIQLFHRLLRIALQSEQPDEKRIDLEYKKLEKDSTVLVNDFEKLKKAFGKYLGCVS